MMKADDLSFPRVKSNMGEIVPEAISKIFIFQSIWCSPISSWIIIQSLIKSLLVFHSSCKQDIAANTFSSYKNNLKESSKHACTWMQTFASPPKQIPSRILHASQVLGNVPSVSKQRAEVVLALSSLAFQNHLWAELMNKQKAKTLNYAILTERQIMRNISLFLCVC